MTDGKISDLSTGLDGQLKYKVKSFIACLVAVDESRNTGNVAQLDIFICDIDKTLTLI